MIIVWLETKLIYLFVLASILYFSFVLVRRVQKLTSKLKHALLNLKKDTPVVNTLTLVNKLEVHQVIKTPQVLKICICCMTCCLG